MNALRWRDKKTGREIMYATTLGETKEGHVLLSLGHTINDFPDGRPVRVIGGEIFEWVSKVSVDIERIP